MVLDIAPDARPPPATLATQRAAHSAWDLHWFRIAARSIRPRDHRVHVQLFPATLREVDPEDDPGVAARPAAIPASLVLAVDELYLSGNPLGLAPRLAPYRQRGVGPVHRCGGVLGGRRGGRWCLLRPQAGPPDLRSGRGGSPPTGRASSP